MDATIGVLTLFAIADIPAAVLFVIVAAVCASLGITGAIAENGNVVFPRSRFVFFALCDVVLLAPTVTALLELTLRLPRDGWYQSVFAQLIIIVVTGCLAGFLTIGLHGEEALESTAMFVRIVVVYTAIGGIAACCAVATCYATLHSFFAAPGTLSWTTIGWISLCWLALSFWVLLCFSSSLPQEQLHRFLQRRSRFWL